MGWLEIEWSEVGATCIRDHEPGKERCSWLQVEPEEPRPEGDRASVVAQKRGNARGAKGGRKVETKNKSLKETRTANVLWTPYGEEQRKYANLRLLNCVCWPPW